MIRSIQDFIPGALIEIGRLWSNVSTLLSNQYSYYMTRVHTLRTLFDPGETELIYEISQLVGAYLTDYDSHRAVRSKTADAIHTHQYNGVFNEVWKPIIDRILGGDSSIYSGTQYYASFVVGESIIGSPSKIGFVPFPTGVTADKLKGEVFIDLDVSPSSDQLQELVSELRPLVPQYFNVYLGILFTLDSDYFVVGLSTIGGIDLIGTDLDPVVTFQNKVKL